MKRPAFQFYPADWRKDAALQSCSVAAQGLWINALCVAHECAPYGHLTVNGQPMNPAQIGRLAGVTADEAGRLIAELEAAGVVSRAADGTLFSRRMVRDEEARAVRAANGPKGAAHGAAGAAFGVKGGRPATPKPPKEPPNKPPKQPPPSSSSSFSTSVEGVPDGTPADFDHAWAAYPSRLGQSQSDARKAWAARIAEGEDAALLLDGVRRYARWCTAYGTSPRFIKHAATFFGPDRHYCNDWTPAPPGAPSPSAATRRATTLAGLMNPTPGEPCGHPRHAPANRHPADPRHDCIDVEAHPVGGAAAGPCGLAGRAANTTTTTTTDSAPG
ncbi:MAG: hypothetical protein V4505_22275 [Pseudomonadota bacterium]